MKLTYSPQAIGDLIEIGNYIKSDNPAAGVRIVEELKGCCSRILDNPFMGRSRLYLRPGLRSFPHKSYMIFYEPFEDSILIVRVLHGAQNVESIMDLN